MLGPCLRGAVPRGPECLGTAQQGQVPATPDSGRRRPGDTCSPWEAGPGVLCCPEPRTLLERFSNQGAPGPVKGRPSLKSRGSQRPHTPGPRQPAPRPSCSAPCGGQPWPCCREETGGPRSLGHLWLLPSPALCLGTRALSRAPRPWSGQGFAGQGLHEGAWAGVGLGTRLK